MSILIDTNVLLRFADSSQPEHQHVWKVVHKLFEEGHEIVTTFQNCAEFWNVATRPKRYNGFGIEHDEAKGMLQLIERLFPLLWHDEESYQKWRDIVTDYDVSGVQVHDAKLIALMLIRGVEQILTFDDQDFNRYEPDGIRTIQPRTFLLTD
jgi:predicted nucleic acid-binding protein